MTQAQIRTFGRRSPVAPLPVAKAPPAVPRPAVESVTQSGSPLAASATLAHAVPESVTQNEVAPAVAEAIASETTSADVDRELAEWKRARGFRLPLKQVSLMASLCFGVAAFVLPDKMNDMMQWVLLALTGASLVAGFYRRRTKSPA